MYSDTQKVLGVKEHSDINRHCVQRLPVVHQLPEELLQPHHGRFRCVAINLLILSHVYSSRNTSKETQLNIFLNLPPRSVLNLLGIILIHLCYRAGWQVEEDVQ